jgi:hypothetical protein
LREEGKSGSREECLASIPEVGTDPRPLILARKEIEARQRDGR